MAARLRRPGDDDLARLLAAAAAEELTYAPVGTSLGGVAPPRLRRHRWTCSLPPDRFDAARGALLDWAVHRGAGLRVAVDGPLRQGTNVALLAPLPVGVVEATCRIVAVVEERDRYGFAYGTLPVHPEQGEESFLVVREGDGLTFVVEAVSRPVHPLARLAPPVAHRLQDAAVRRYLEAMRAAAGR